MKPDNSQNRFFYSSARSLGMYCRVVIDTFKDIRKGNFSWRDVSSQIIRIGVTSLPIVLLTSVFTGMVMALQTAYGLQRFGAKNYVGNIVGLSIIRELGPVLTAVMLCGRVGAGIAAEIASMVVTEQVDAIRALGASPSSKLVTPRILAGLIVVPLLVVFADVIGIYGGLIIAIAELGISSYSYYTSLLYTVVPRDFINGLLKSLIFGFLLISIACYRGLTTRGGTAGVGQSTTSAAVTGSIVVFIADFFLTKLFIILRI
jgi:phospholipid/cholesterol/gamma-HCH transport system permease protein